MALMLVHTQDFQDHQVHLEHLDIIIDCTGEIKTKQKVKIHLNFIFEAAELGYLKAHSHKIRLMRAGGPTGAVQKIRNFLFFPTVTVYCSCMLICSKFEAV